MNYKIVWPEKKKFAFTIFDDTDCATLENVKEVYSFLLSQGFRTTKSVWPIEGHGKPVNGGVTCEDKTYYNWANELKRNGFEIAYHNATFHGSAREEIVRGIERFVQLFGQSPKSMANHTGCEDAIYWGNNRLTGINEKIYNFLTRGRRQNIFRGHVGGDRYFWGDICKEKIKYVRNFVFQDINTLKSCPYMPYHDPIRKYVNYWFASSEGANIKRFNDCISEKNQDRLEREGGACIMYTHFAFGFCKGKSIDPRFKFLIKRLSKKNGWFIPVSTLLDYLLKMKGGCDLINENQRNELERRWLLHKIRTGTA